MEHVTVVRVQVHVLGDVGEVRQIVGVLAGAVDVADFVLANCPLLGGTIYQNINEMSTCGVPFWVQYSFL